MKLRNKLGIFNLASKALLVIIFLASFTPLINYIALLNTDQYLEEKKNQAISIIKSEGIHHFLEKEGRGAYGSYNLFKEEYISLEKVPESLSIHNIKNTQRSVEGDVINYRVLSHTFKIGRNNYLLEIGKKRSTIGDQAVALQPFLLLIFVVLLFVSSITDLLYTRYLLRPFRKIVNNKLQNVRHPSLFDYTRVNTTTTDFQYLDRSINEMMEKIDNAFQKEKEFIANVSHELLTPLSVLQNKLENVMQEENLSEKAMQKVVEAQKTISHLRNVIRSLLFISKIENEQFLKQEQVSIRNLIAEVAAEAEDRLESRNIRLYQDIQEDYVINRGNRSLLYTMFFNLIKNSIKYNKENGTIEFAAYYQKLQYIVEVRDTGEGIDAENLPYIFDRFRRFSGSESESQTGGFGIGLPVVKTIADFHNIDIRVQSDKGKGTTFYLYFNTA